MERRLLVADAASALAPLLPPTQAAPTVLCLLEVLLRDAQPQVSWLRARNGMGCRCKVDAAGLAASITCGNALSCPSILHFANAFHRLRMAVWHEARWTRKPLLAVSSLGGGAAPVVSMLL